MIGRKPTEDSEPAADLRARVIAALGAAGFRHREDHLPTRTSGGTFGAYGSDRSGVNVVADWWDVDAADLEGLRGWLAEALEQAGFTVRDFPRRIYVPPETPPEDPPAAP